MDNKNQNQPLTQLAERLHLTDPEPEEYILTPEEETIAISYKIERLKEYYAWKMSELGYNENQILEKIKATNWDEEFDKEKLLQELNSSKHQNIWHSNLRKQEKIQEEGIRKENVEKQNAKFVFTLMKWTSENIFGKKLIVNEYNKKLITALCFFLSNDERFEKQLGYSFRKGILIRGISGLGKTHLVRCVENNLLFPIQVFSMFDIADQIKENGEIKFSLAENKIIYLDDVGTEETVINHYGTKINFFKNFIETVYLRNQGKGFSGLMISTNNSFAEMEHKYGFRVRSRIKEIFNIIDIEGQDMRK